MNISGQTSASAAKHFLDGHPRAEHINIHGRKFVSHKKMRYEQMCRRIFPDKK